MNLKIVNLIEAVKIVQSWKNQGLEICFTNGCFDLLHYGHIAYLRQAKNIADKLVVGLNSDASVSRLKGKNRPISNEISRAAVLEALEMVDLVIIFEQDTPLDLICALTPDLLVKGGDYVAENIVGADWVIQHGGQVKSLSLEQGYSTTQLEQKIASSYAV
jgi:D-glycero-beta-D-manno-heptose 1-phosphate adenylyltransferase